MDFLKEWNDVEETLKKIIPIFAKWQKDNLKITHGDYVRKRTIYDSMMFTYGLPYTSSGMYAEAGNTNVQAEKYNKELKVYMSFRCIRLDSEGNIYVVFDVADYQELYEVIGNIH